MPGTALGANFGNALTVSGLGKKCTNDPKGRRGAANEGQPTATLNLNGQELGAIA